ncbi:hypothetical protein B0H14DRAFT_2609988 [Mycena olivaceomarginata]|nr:hypothetical protein B0H14DRAFT_2609988 [Mycena olivaceomarginata]
MSLVNIKNEKQPTLADSYAPIPEETQFERLPSDKYAARLVVMQSDNNLQPQITKKFSEPTWKEKPATAVVKSKKTKKAAPTEPVHSLPVCKFKLGIESELFDQAVMGTFKTRYYLVFVSLQLAMDHPTAEYKNFDVFTNKGACERLATPECGASCDAAARPDVRALSNAEMVRGTTLGEGAGRGCWREFNEMAQRQARIHRKPQTGI